jgi:acyl-CoA synthetase (AMP-forming)/AMP-acid ligase II
MTKVGRTEHDAPSFADIIAGHARERPDAVALRYQGQATSYAELDRLSNRIANFLLLRGHPGDRIAYLGKNSDIAVALTIGVAKAGMVLVPIIWRLAAEEIGYIVMNSMAKLLFVEAEFAAQAQALPSLFPAPHPAVVQIDGVPAAKDWASFAEWLPSSPADDVDVPVDADDVLLQIYTSGTTGRPKGAMLTHANATRYRQFIDAADIEWLRAAPGETALLAMPFGHIAGVGQALLILLSGEEMIIHREFDPGAVLDAIETHRLKRLFLVPAALQMLLAHPKADNADFSSLRYFSYGASPIPVPLLEAGMARLGCRFFQVYGMTETWGGVVALPPEDHDPARRHLLASAGKPMPGVEIRIRDADGHVLGAGLTGEIEVRSPSTMAGYWGQEDATRAALSADGWLRTGDAGMIDDEGYVFIQDRIKDMIISGAENIYPAEVESALYAHPDVADVAVIGVPDAKWGEAVKAVVVPVAGAAPDPAALIAFARERIAGYKCPKSIDFVEALPRNPSGKILRRELREPHWAGRERRVN